MKNYRMAFMFFNFNESDTKVSVTLYQNNFLKITNILVWFQKTVLM